MAKFALELPTEVMDNMKKVYDNTGHIFGEMTKAGAEVVYHEVVANVPDGIRKSKMMKNLKITRVYRTPSDGGINTKVGFYGYFENEDGKTVPAPLVANVFEHGRSTSPFPKQPFFRKSFRKAKIEKAMLEAQKKASGGLLDDE